MDVGTFFNVDDRGQVSAELLIVLAAMAALALFLWQMLSSSAQSMGSTYERKIEELNKLVEEGIG